MRQLTLRAWQRWQAAAGYWRGWSVCPALFAAAVPGVPAAAPPGVKSMVSKLSRSLGEPTAVVLDLDPVLGVHVAAELNRRRIAHAVLVLPRWPYADALLPVDALIATLIKRSRYLQSEHMPNVVFVLDAERTQAVARGPFDRRADNRYCLTAADLPDLAALRRRGIRRIVKLTHS